MAGVPGIGDIQGRLAIDGQALAALRAQAKTSPDAALEKVASQFEALFLQMMLKTMRESVGQDGPFDSEATRSYLGMLDQQLAASLSGRSGLGLAEILAKQLRSAATAASPGSSAAAPIGVDAAIQVMPAGESGAAPPASVNPFHPRDGYGTQSIEPLTISDRAAAPGHVREFIDRIGAQAALAGRETGVPARFIAAQAALESNWGRSEIRGADGAPSHNLFGVKAGRGWTGKTVVAVTTEYVDGVAARSTEKFRAYDSYADAFLDYARLLKGRYKEAIAAGGDAVRFAQGLQRGGYATDPRYAEKVARIINTNFSVGA